MHCLVLGAGVSGKAAALLLSSKGYTVSISNTAEVSASDQEVYAAQGIELRIGPQTEATLQGIDQVFQSPGISLDTPIIKSIKQKKIPLASEVDLALKYFSGNLIAITGTNGKSTTTAMTEHLIKQSGASAAACGNIGVPMSDILLRHKPYGVWVAELSSYQIETSSPIKSKIAVFTSFSPDHLGRHGTVETYFKTKWALILMAEKALLSLEVAEQAEKFGLKLSERMKVIRPLDETCGCEFAAKHDYLNAAFACEAAAVVTIGRPEEFHQYLTSFAPLPHRYQKIGEVNGHAIINDSKATNVDSVMRALENQTEACILFWEDRERANLSLHCLKTS